MLHGVLKGLHALTSQSRTARVHNVEVPDAAEQLLQLQLQSCKCKPLAHSV